MCFEFPFNMIGKLAIVSLTRQSWRVLKSWYGRPKTKNLGAVSQTFLAGVWLRYVCNAGYVFIAETLFGFITAELSLPRQAGKLQFPINTEFHLEVQKLFNMRTYEQNLEQK